jgi:uncharacterized protein (DUF433 family)
VAGIGGFYSVGEAASITGVPPSTLHYWIRTDLVHASQATGRWILDFLDLRDVKVVAELRSAGAKLHKIRRAIDWLRDYDEEVDRLLDANFYVNGNGDVTWDEGGTGLALAANRGGQICVKLSDINRSLGISAGPGKVLNMRPIPEVEINPAVRGGTPVVRGTRVPTELVSELVQSGYTKAEIVELYPSVPPEAIEAIARWERQRAERVA